MCWFCRKPKTALQLLEAELKRSHRLAKDSWARDEAQANIKKITETLINSASIELNKKLEERLKGIEDSIGDLYLLGKSDDSSKQE